MPMADGQKCKRLKTQYARCCVEIHPALQAIGYSDNSPVRVLRAGHRMGLSHQQRQKYVRRICAEIVPTEMRSLASSIRNLTQPLFKNFHIALYTLKPRFEMIEQPHHDDECVLLAGNLGRSVPGRAVHNIMVSPFFEIPQKGATPLLLFNGMAAYLYFTVGNSG